MIDVVALGELLIDFAGLSTTKSGGISSVAGYEEILNRMDT